MQRGVYRRSFILFRIFLRFSKNRIVRRLIGTVYLRKKRKDWVVEDVVVDGYVLFDVVLVSFLLFLRKFERTDCWPSRRTN